MNNVPEGPRFQRPSSTITAAALTGMACALLIRVLGMFGVAIPDGFGTELTVFVSALVGYVWPESVLRKKILAKHGIVEGG